MARRIRSCAIDVDGTLLTSDGRVTERTVRVLQRARAEGVLPIICTGKIPGPWQEAVRAMELDAPMVFLQGALVLDAAGEVLLERRIDPEACAAALALTDALEAEHGRDMACCLACCGGTYRATGPSPMAREVPAGFLAHGEPEPQHVGAPLASAVDVGAVNKLVVLFSDEMPGLAEMGDRVRSAVGEGADVVAYSDNPNVVEVTPKGVSKGAALSELLPTLGLGLDSLLAIGDGSNDLSMLELAGLSVAMGNGAPDVLKCADVVTLTNDAEGVAEAIETYVLEKGKL